MTASILAPALTLLGACGGGGSPASSAAPTRGSESERLEGPSDPLVVFTGLSTPESALHDPEADVYLVSNVGGAPLDADSDGFISRLSPDGPVIDLRFIDGSREGVTLNAPKGMALTAEHLVVADLDHVRFFGRRTGAPAGEVRVPGASFLNDVTVDPLGRIFVSDSGLEAGDGGLSPSATDAIWKIALGEDPEPVIRSPELGRPNGIFADGGVLWVVTMGSGELLQVAQNGNVVSRQSLPASSLDGIVRIGTGEMLISSWETASIFRGAPGGDFVPVLEGLEAPADIGFDSQRQRVIVPLFRANEVVVHSLP